MNSVSLINAGPGTGKTRVLSLGYLMLKGDLPKVDATEEQQAIYNYMKEMYHSNASVCFLAHSNSAKDNLITRLGKKAQIYTLHGLGMSNIIRRYGYQRLVSNRTERHIQTITGTPLRSMGRDDKSRWYAIKRLLHYLKLEAMEPTEEALSYIKKKYADMDNHKIPRDWKEDTETLLEYSRTPDGEVEFADMLFMGKQAIQRPRFDVGFVDEGQDLSMASYQLIIRTCKNVLVCGDSNQAINAFAGASEEMYQHIANVSDAIFPMKQTQRCPPHICEAANGIREGGIIEGPNQKYGVISKMNRCSLPEMLMELPPREGKKLKCLFVSRTNAGLISFAMFMNKKSIPFFILDKDLAKELIGYTKRTKPRSKADLLRVLSREKAWANSHPSKRYRQMILDKVNPLLELLNYVDTLPELHALIQELCQSDKTGYMGTTIDKAKGLEADHVFCLNPPIEVQSLMDHKISAEQERNRHFVALTRSSENFYWVYP